MRYARPAEFGQGLGAIRAKQPAGGIAPAAGYTSPITNDWNGKTGRGQPSGQNSMGR